MAEKRLICPICHRGELMLKYEAKYVYSYFIDSDAPGLKNTIEFLPFLYDKREQMESAQYIECEVCGMNHPCVFEPESNHIDVRELTNAINNTFKNN